tara:strand:+ start:6970 stop:7818 length:849 start_codon:yes stop_codon:yes gene_type:complete
MNKIIKSLFKINKKTLNKIVKPNVNFKDKPIISVIMACREGCTQTSDLLRSISSMVDKADNPKNLELCIKFDHDDQNVAGSIEKIKKFTDKLYNFKYLITPRGKGYDDLHFYYIDMIREFAESNSTTILPISDDSEFIYENYDKMIIEFLKNTNVDIFCLQTREKNKYSYPIWSRRFIETVGLGYIASCDIWGEEIIKATQKLCDKDIKTRNVKVNFWAEDYTKNKTPIIKRHLAPKDNTLEGIRGDAIRKLQEFTQTKLWKRSVDQHALNLYNIIKMQLNK